MARQTSRAHNRHYSGSIQSLTLLLERSERERTGLFWAEGCRSFFSSLEQNWTVLGVVYCPKLLRSGSAWEKLRTLNVPRHPVSVDEFQDLTRRKEPDGIGVLCEQRWTPLIDAVPKIGDVWVALDSIRTPGNLGTIMRSCAAVGARGLMLVGGETDPFDPSAIRSSMGALFSVPLIRTSVKAVAGWKQRRPEVQFVGASPGALCDYREASYLTPMVLMMGSERTGLRARLENLCDLTVRLPMTGAVDSLNLAVATSVMLYEAMRAP